MLIRIFLPILCILFFMGGVEAQSVKNSSEIFDQSFIKETTVPDYTACVSADGTSKPMFRCIADVFFEFINRVMVVIAIGFLVWGGVKLILSRGNDEAVFTQRKTELFAVASGFLVFLIGQIAVDNVFFGDGTWFSGSEEAGVATAQSFAKEGWIQLEGIFDYVTSFIVAIATLYIIVTSFQVLFSFGNEESGTKLKNRIIYAIFGLILVTSIKHIVRLFTHGVEYGKLGNIQTGGIVGFFLEWANMIIGVLGLLAVLALVWAGFILIVGFGNEGLKDTAKKIVLYVTIGLVLLLSSWTIIYFVTSGAQAG